MRYGVIEEKAHTVMTLAPRSAYSPAERDFIHGRALERQRETEVGRHVLLLLQLGNQPLMLVTSGGVDF
jgi:hypothetical protein